jgi:hypothetical protein
MMSVGLSIAAALSGLMIVGPLVVFTWSEPLLTKTLSSHAALFEFWTRRFEACRGVMGLLLSENPDRPKPESRYCRVVILAEYESLKRLRRHGVVVFAVLGILWAWVSLHVSLWVLVWFLGSVAAGALVNRKKGYENALYNIFRATRLWMWADEPSLKAEGGHLLITQVANLLNGVETVQNPADHPLHCICEKCLAILEDAPAQLNFAGSPFSERDFQPRQRRLARFLDRMAVQMMLGSLSKQVTYEYEQAGYPSKEAKELAGQEMLVSMRAISLNVDSYSEVRAWKQSYMANRTRIPHR